MGKILILGKTPPPIGGVTVHVSRLIENLEFRNFNDFTFCDLGKESALKILSQIQKHKILHLHVSRPILQTLAAIYCRIAGKTLLITYHGNWGRYSHFGNWLVIISAWLAAIPIVQNEESLKKAMYWNKKTVLISTFLPPLTLTPLSTNIAQALTKFLTSYERILCTNAWNLTFDKNGQETYGISEIVKWIEKATKTAMVISDPSGNYSRFVQKKLGSISANIIFITEPHDFRNILRLSHAFIRNTTTDGVCLSIHEAKALNVPVLASAAVARPYFCRVYKEIGEIDLEEDIEQARKLLLENTANMPDKEPIEELMRLYALFIKPCEDQAFGLV